MSKALFQTLILIAGMGIVTAAFATDAAEADDSGMSFDDKLAACTACHGENGAKPILPEYPVLAGQYESYLANSLRQYRDGQRTNEVMALQLEILELSDTDIDRLAAHFSSQESPLHSLAD